MAKSGVEGVRHDPRYRLPYQARWTVNGVEEMARFATLEEAAAQVAAWKDLARRPDMEDLFFEFVHERHLVWSRRLIGEDAPWSTDPVLASKKFTNVFRVLDPGSQYVVKMLQEPGLSPEDAFARCLLYRYTNRPETWEALRSVYGRWPLASDMGDGLADVLCDWRDQGHKVFSGAYIILPAPNQRGDKVRQAVALAARLAHPQSPENVVKAVVGATTPQAAFDALTAHYGVGNFMAMQVLTDWGYYSPSWDENAFVVAGPGSRRGTAHLGRAESPEDTIRWVRRVLANSLPPTLPTPGFGRPPSLMDIQNCFCEFSKYVRYIVRGDNTSRPYTPAHPGEQPIPVLPHHWS